MRFALGFGDSGESHQEVPRVVPKQLLLLWCRPDRGAYACAVEMWGGWAAKRG